LTGLILGLVLAAPLFAGTKLVLQDGQVLEGTDVRRDGGLYLLEQESGAVMTIPVELVKEVQLEQDAPKFDPRTGITSHTKPETLAGSSTRPAGVVVGQPQTLAGQEVRAPSRSEQLSALGPPSEFAKDIIDPTWHPTSDWNNNPEEMNNFAPSTWSKGVVDSDWAPKDAYEGKDASAGQESSWQKSTINNEWVPQDGFKKN
jgi:hypothetical protein